MTLKTVWLASTNEEVWNSFEEYSSREEAIEHHPTAYAVEAGQTFYTGIRHAVTLDDIRSCYTPCAPLEMISEALYDHEYGGDEWTEGWPALDDEDEEKLRELIADTIRSFLDDKGCVPTWFTIKDMKSHTAKEPI